MSIATESVKVLFCLALTGFLFGCEEEPPPPAPEPAVTAKPAPTPTEIEKPPPPPKPREDCPEGSSGIGTMQEPCMGSEDSRMMEVKYTGKTTDQGPKFAITNLTDKPILYGSIVVYFYDKKGNLLDVAGTDKPRKKQTCSGNIFAGQVNPKEKIYVFFSCVKESHVPEGTTAIEGELQTVGFADETGKKTEFYWRNKDLVPDDRPKGGIKTKSKKKKKKK